MWSRRAGDILLRLWLTMLLFVAADPMEFTGLTKFCANLAPAGLPVVWSRGAQLNGESILMIANGAGANRAAQAVDSASARAGAGDLRAVISTGFCGGLDPALRIGDIFVASSVQGLPIPAPRSARAHSRGALVTIDHVAQTAAEKRNLYASGASVVDMEARWVAERAGACGLLFYCVRSVTDLAEETFANDLNRALRADGHFDTMQILRSAIRHPATRLPELVRLRKRCRMAARTLGEFLADCRF